MKMLSFGEILWDVYPDAKTIGGASLNLAAHCALLGGDVYIASAVGDDKLGKEALLVTRSFNIKDDFISVYNDKETGVVLVTLRSSGVPSYEIKKSVAYDYIKLPLINNAKFDVLAFGTLALRGEHNKQTLSSLLRAYSFSEIYADLNIRLPHSTQKSAELCLSNATIIKISDEELPTVSDWIFSKEYAPKDFAIEISKRYKNLKLIIITKGDKGSIAYEVAGQLFYHSNAVPTKVISTVGAGDSFGAAFLTKHFAGEDIQVSLDFASEVSSYVCSHKQAVPDISHFV